VVLLLASVFQVTAYVCLVDPPPRNGAVKLAEVRTQLAMHVAVQFKPHAGIVQQLRVDHSMC
jgi:hypothetical protein